MKNHKLVRKRWILTNKLKTDDPCNIKLWLMYFTTIIFPYMQKKLTMKAQCHFKLSFYEDFYFIV